MGVRRVFAVVVMVLLATLGVASAYAADNPPDTEILPPFVDLTRDNTPTFTFNVVNEAPEQYIDYNCFVDGVEYGAAVPCGTGGLEEPKEFRVPNNAPLADGPHTFSVAAGLLIDMPCCSTVYDPTPASRPFVVDTTPPETTITSGPASGSTLPSDAASFRFTSSEPGGALTCRLDGNDPVACNSGAFETGHVAKGSHQFEVFATDTVGNPDRTPAVRSFIAPKPPPAATATCRGEDVSHRGTLGDDQITGTAGDDVISASTGADQIDGGGGDDVICAGDGKDRVEAGRGDDRVFGGTRADRLDGGPGADLLQGGPQKDTCVTDSADTTKGCEK